MRQYKWHLFSSMASKIDDGPDGINIARNIRHSLLKSDIYIYINKRDYSSVLKDGLLLNWSWKKQWAQPNLLKLRIFKGEGGAASYWNGIDNYVAQGPRSMGESWMMIILVLYHLQSRLLLWKIGAIEFASEVLNGAIYLTVRRSRRSKLRLAMPLILLVSCFR